MSGLVKAAVHSDEAFRVLLQAFGSDHPEVRLGVVASVLYASRDPCPTEVEQVLAAARRDPDCDMRLSATMAMARRAETDAWAWEIIEEAMRSDDRCVRSGAFHVVISPFGRRWDDLTKVRPPDSVVPLLLGGLADEDHDVLRYAADVISQLDLPVGMLKQYADEVEALLEHEDRLSQRFKGGP